VIFRKAALISLMLILGLGICGTVQAMPVRYTFEGTVTGLWYDNVALVKPSVSDPGETLSVPYSDQNFAYAQTITYTLELDFSAPGSYIQTYPNLTPPTNINRTYLDTALIDYFEVNYISGDAIELDPSIAWANGNILEWYKGQDYRYGSLLTGSTYNTLDLRLLTDVFNGWDGIAAVGDIQATNIAKDSNGHVYKVYSKNLQLISSSISSSGPSPVPEPATIFLFGMGLIGLAGYSRKKLKKR